MTRSTGPPCGRLAGPLVAGALGAALAVVSGAGAQEIDAGLLLPESAVTDEAGVLLAARIEAFYASISGLRAEVVQRFHHRIHERDVDAEGELTVRRPDRLRILYEGGRGIAIEGTTYRAYEPEGDLVHEGEVPEDMLVDLLGVLAGTMSLRDAFDVRGLPSRPEGDLLEVRPRVRTPRWDRAILLVGPDGAISRLLVVDPTGSWLRLELRDVTYPRVIPSGDLTLPEHAGATVVAP